MNGIEINYADGFEVGDLVKFKPISEITRILGVNSGKYFDFLKEYQNTPFTIKQFYHTSDNEYCCYSNERIEKLPTGGGNWLIRLSTIQHCIDCADICNSESSIGSLFSQGG